MGAAKASLFAAVMVGAASAAAPPARRLEESSVCTTLATQVCGEGGVSTLYGSVDGEQVCADAGGCAVYGGSTIAQGSSYCNIFCDGGCSNDAIRGFVDTHDAGVMSLQCTGQAQLRAYVLMPLCWVLGVWFGFKILKCFCKKYLGIGTSPARLC